MYPTRSTRQVVRVADPHNFKCGAGSDFLIYCGSGSCSCSSATCCESASTGLHTLQGPILNLLDSIVNIHGLRLNCEPSKLLKFRILNFADPDPAFYSLSDHDSASQIIQIWIRNPVFGSRCHCILSFYCIPISVPYPFTRRHNRSHLFIQ